MVLASDFATFLAGPGTNFRIVFEEIFQIDMLQSLQMGFSFVYVFESCKWGECPTQVHSTDVFINFVNSNEIYE